MPIDAETITTIMKDGMPALEVLAGSKAVALFIEKVSSALGWYLEPRQIERKARAEAVASVIKAEADQEVKSLSERAVARIIYEETKHQRNVEAIALGAIGSIDDESKPENLDEDWLDGFFAKCRHVSNQEMQKLWSQILAGEVNNPGKFSPRTVDMLSTLTKEDALLFRRLVTFIWIEANESATPTLMLFRDVIAEIDKYNLPIDEILYLQEMGFVIVNTAREVQIGDINKGDMIYKYHGKEVTIGRQDGTKKPLIDSLPVGFVLLTKVGRELSTICTVEPDWAYMEYSIERWDSMGFTVKTNLEKI